MFKKKLDWKTPLFYLCLPIFFIMVFLGFPPPVAPPPGSRAKQEQSVPAQKQDRLDEL
jgi:hypothetical protein